ncbi:hypothetical protein BJV82DRAFT_662601 [Fennellomyces sp. T-0311]|nr:hypothetical protein BJV82DRAFT_662601 [Fennellomyces sp. T-0311]
MSLRCRVCGKELPEFDQRGFRNAGFTAHQNRCIERERERREGAARPPQRAHTMNIPRRLLPASPLSNGRPSSLRRRRHSSTTTHAPASSPPYPQHWVPASQQPHPPLRPPVAAMLPVASHHLPPPPPRPPLVSSSMPQVYSLPTPSDLLQERTPIEYFPVQHCDYCVPQGGLHDPNCYLLQFVTVATMAPHGPSSSAPY